MSSINNNKTLAEPNRRRILVALGALVGSAAAAHILGGNALSVAMAYSPKQDSAATAGQVLSQSQMLQLRDICRLVIPATDTLGAADVDAHGFVDHQLFNCYPSDEQQEAVNILALIDKKAVQNFKKPFSNCQESEQLSLLTDLETPNQGFTSTDKKQFKFIKALIVFGYYTSKVGATMELNYLPVPGGFKGSIPYDSVGKAWAT
jgi:hypothetical protein